MNINEWIDVSTRLTNFLPFSNTDIDSNSDCIHVSNGSYNIVNSFRLLELSTVKSIIIGDDCFENVELFNIDGLNELKSLKIGKNSFTKKKNSYGNDELRSFSILNCIELKSIEIGRYSFSDYGGEFELNNLPKLSTIKIGEIGSRSYNFRYSSFEIKGIIDVDIINE